MRDIVAFVYNKKNDINLTHAFTISAFAREYQVRGYSTVTFDINARSSRDKLLKLLRDGRVAFVHCEQGQTLGLKGQVESKKVNLFDYFRTPVVAQIRDPLFTPWLTSQFRSPPNNLICAHTDSENIRMAKVFRCDKGIHFKWPHTHYSYFPNRTWEFDSSELFPEQVFYVGGFQEPDDIRYYFKKSRPELNELFDLLCEKSLSRPGESVFSLAQEEESFQDYVTKNQEDAINFIFYVHQFRRYYLRAKMFDVLFESGVKIFWNGPKPKVSRISDGVVSEYVRGRLPLEQVLRLQSIGKTIVSYNTNGSDVLGERVANALLFGSSAVVNGSEMLDKFDFGDQILSFDSFETLPDAIARVVTEKKRPDFHRVHDDWLVHPRRLVEKFLGELNLLGMPSVPNVGSRVQTSWKPSEVKIGGRVGLGFEKIIKNSSGVIEYGAGNTTVFAAQNNVPVFSIETDVKFCERVKAYLPKFGPFKCKAVDFGGVSNWGIPINLLKTEENRQKINEYLESPWFAAWESGIVPDLLMVDGRFRVASVAFSIIRGIEKNIKLYIVFDDYYHRPFYHDLHEILRYEKSVGSAVVFTIPNNVTKERAKAVLEEFIFDWR